MQQLSFKELEQIGWLLIFFFWPSYQAERSQSKKYHTIIWHITSLEMIDGNRNQYFQCVRLCNYPPHLHCLCIIIFSHKVSIVVKKYCVLLKRVINSPCVP